jgi:hypothetical protein
VGSHHGVMAGSVSSLGDLCDLLLKICLCALSVQTGSSAEAPETDFEQGDREDLKGLPVGSHHRVMTGRVSSLGDLCELLLKICLCGLLSESRPELGRV